MRLAPEGLLIRWGRLSSPKKKRIAKAELDSILARDWDGLTELMIILAQWAALHLAQNYRDFSVGCALLAFNVFGEYRIVLGGNTMNRKGGSKICAELDAFHLATGNRFDYFEKIAVIGPPQRDKESGVDSQTLPPCYVCRFMMQNSFRVPLDTLIVTATPDGKTREFNTLRSLLIRHNALETKEQSGAAVRLTAQAN